MTLPYLECQRPIPIAHRGGNVAAPENTIAAFSHAVELGYRYLETDVHLTSDGVLVAFHDADLGRLAGLPGAIRDHAWDVLRTVDLGDGQTIPTMDELLGTFPSTRFNIDPKADETVEPLAALVSAQDAVDRVGVGSFDDARIATLQELLGPGLCTSPGPMELLTFLSLESFPSVAFETHGCLQIPVRFGQFELTGELLDDAHSRGLQVHVWTINDADEMAQLLDLGVDALMTDNTELLLEVLVGRGQWPAAENGPDQS